MLSKHDKTLMNNRTKFINRIKDIYSAGKIYKSKANWFTHEISNKVYSEVGYKNLTVFIKGELSGIQLILWDNLYHDLDFRYFIDNEWIECHNLTSEQMHRLNSDSLCGHFWAGSDKPFSLTNEWKYNRKVYNNEE